jgi:hypothetical protein
MMSCLALKKERNYPGTAFLKPLLKPSLQGPQGKTRTLDPAQSSDEATKMDQPKPDP